MHKIIEVGMLQPAGVTVYEYNAPGKIVAHMKRTNKHLCQED